MVHSCSAYNCTQRWKKGISFHKFPKNEMMLMKWVHAVNRKDWKPSATSVLCFRHFTEDCYEQNGWSSIKMLKDTAVPTIFDLSMHSHKEENKRVYSCKRKQLDLKNLQSSSKKDLGKTRKMEKNEGQGHQKSSNSRAHLATTSDESLLGRMLRMLKDGS